MKPNSKLTQTLKAHKFIKSSAEQWDARDNLGEKMKTP